ncbi:MAG: dUTP diphosphatase, partial [Actinomycetota bacterium]|nr:dUTP diphosphatase [Actinomycetota bacterium]
MSPDHPLQVPFRRLVPEAGMPERAHLGDAGYDLRSVERADLAPGARALVRTGISIAIPEGYAGLVLPRSGLAVRHGISLVNTPGLIDSGYRGEIRVPLINHDRKET